MADQQEDQREAQTISRWICIAYWTVIVAPVAAFLALFPLGMIFFLLAPGYLFNEGPAHWLGAVYLIVWIGGAFLLAYRGHFPGTAIPRPGRCAKCDYDLRGNTSAVCPECGSSTSTYGTEPRPSLDREQIER